MVRCSVAAASHHDVGRFRADMNRENEDTREKRGNCPHPHLPCPFTGACIPSRDNGSQGSQASRYLLGPEIWSALGTHARPRFLVCPRSLSIPAQWLVTNASRVPQGWPRFSMSNCIRMHGHGHTAKLQRRHQLTPAIS